VKGTSGDYIYLASDDSGDYIVDYGGISNETIVDILATRFLSSDPVFRDYIVPILAERLKVELRNKKLSRNEYFDLRQKEIEKND
jgi:hypothetical protein